MLNIKSSMMRKFPMLLGILCLATNAFSQEKVDDTKWYTSKNSKGYISVQNIDGSKSNSLYTTVKANFDTDVLDFSLRTICDNNKMVASSQIIFDGTIDSSIKPVHFTGSRIKIDNKGNSYWHFDGDFVDEVEKDPDFQRYTYAKYNATLKMPERTIPSFNIWAIVPQLAFDREGTFIFNSLDETKLHVRKNQTVNYLGTANITRDGKTMPTHKFVHQGKNMQPAYYWVSEDRVLVQVLLDNKYNFTLTTKEAALQNNQ